VTIEFTEAEMKVFDEIHRLSGRPQDLKETMLRLAAKELTQLKKSRGEMPVREKQSNQPSTQQSPPPAEVKKEAISEGKAPSKETSLPLNSRTISVTVKRSVWERAHGRCEYRAENGARCEARYSLEYDHVTPVSLGGLSNKDNLRVYCRQHNVLAATQIFGRTHMVTYLPKLR